MQEKEKVATSRRGALGAIFIRLGSINATNFRKLGVFTFFNPYMFTSFRTVINKHMIKFALSAGKAFK
jgi:hypothetical protein